MIRYYFSRTKGHKDEQKYLCIEVDDGVNLLAQEDFSQTHSREMARSHCRGYFMYVASQAG